jgi:hypothetical protein
VDDALWMRICYSNFGAALKEAVPFTACCSGQWSSTELFRLEKKGCGGGPFQHPFAPATTFITFKMTIPRTPHYQPSF